MCSDANRPPTAVVFPGQGSQQAGFGRQWESHPAFVTVVERAEQATGVELAHLLLDPDADLSGTRDAQLAVLLGSLVAWEAAQPEVGSPAAWAGHSLGQVTALIASGAVTFDDGLRLAVARAEATAEAAREAPGSLVALLGASEEQAEAACADVRGSGQEVWVANVNAPGQIVAGGTPAGVEALNNGAPGHGIRRCRPLAVGGAFHTPLMARAVDRLRPVLADTAFAAPSAPVAANDDASLVSGGDGWAERLGVHLVRPVRWWGCVDSLVAAGVQQFVEVGPGTTLAGLIRRCAPDLVVRAVGSPDDLPLGAAS